MGKYPNHYASKQCNKLATSPHGLEGRGYMRSPHNAIYASSFPTVLSTSNLEGDTGFFRGSDLPEAVSNLTAKSIGTLPACNFVEDLNSTAWAENIDCSSATTFNWFSTPNSPAYLGLIMQGEASKMAPEDTMLECYVEALPPYQSIVLSTQPRPQIGTRREATMMIGMDISKGRQPILDDKSNTTLEHFYRPLHCNPVPSSAPTTSLKCPHPACQSKVLYTRKCDLEKHYRSHFRKYFCRISECSLCEMNSLTVSGSGYSGFATRKDRDRHERSHFPALSCKCCGKVFSRLDNLRDHWRKRHSETTFPM